MNDYSGNYRKYCCRYAYLPSVIYFTIKFYKEEMVDRHFLIFIASVGFGLCFDI